MATYNIGINEVPHERDITLQIGDSLRDRWTLQIDQSGTATALDLTNATMTLDISTGPGGTSLLSAGEAADTGSSGVIIDSATDGQFSVSVTGSDCTSLGVGRHYYEVAATWSSGDSTLPNQVKTLLAGVFEVREDV